jgi:hypothetical protein
MAPVGIERLPSSISNEEWLMSIAYGAHFTSITQEGARQMEVFKKQLEKNHFKVLSAIPENDLKELVRIFTNILEAQKYK